MRVSCRGRLSSAPWMLILGRGWRGCTDGRDDCRQFASAVPCTSLSLQLRWLRPSRCPRQGDFGPCNIYNADETKVLLPSAGRSAVAVAGDHPDEQLHHSSSAVWLRDRAERRTGDKAASLMVTPYLRPLDDARNISEMRARSLTLPLRATSRPRPSSDVSAAPRSKRSGWLSAPRRCTPVRWAPPPKRGEVARRRAT